LGEVVRLYEGRFVESLSYATVRDYCDSCENIPELSSTAEDLKDVQRCWALKAIIANIPVGGRLIEIGAGEPLVAAFLTRCGYQVTVVDPYEGHGNGPMDLDSYRKAYPDVNFVKAKFDDDVGGLREGGYDACYSISVLEHVAFDELLGVFAGIRRFMRPSGWSIHAIDFVERGIGAEYHLELVHLVAKAHGISQDRIVELLEAASEDPDTYFLSAEAHNKWRGSVPYDDFPMRRCMSIQIAQPCSKFDSVADFCPAER
jgi:hypothetical protein